MIIHGTGSNQEEAGQNGSCFWCVDLINAANPRAIQDLAQEVSGWERHFSS
jgi:hypothetical protein